MRGVAVLGSTGSIGTSALAVLGRQQDRFQVVALTARGNRAMLDRQVAAFQPSLHGLVSERGPALLVEAATHPDAHIVLNAVVGTAGLDATLAALRAGKRVALANKESLVMAGDLVRAAAREGGGELVPVDSEHSAVLQCVTGREAGLSRLILTASGGPLWNMPREQMRDVKPEQALQHPNWKMGAKITIDSATMMNKGLEVVEARWLFDMPASQIEVLVHRESVIHSMVEYRDGSVIAQLGLPDMRTPISYAMKYPARVPLELPPLDLASIGKLTFFSPDHDRFPCLQLGYDTLKIGGTMPAVLNAANEIAVAAYLQKGIGFLDIADVIRSTMDTHTLRQVHTLDDALEADRWAREKAGARVHALVGNG